jgi:hypothetical protein
MIAGRDVICRRTADGVLRCNIAQLHQHHSVTGFEIGYPGRGPADLALNILAIFIPAPADPRPMLAAEEPRMLNWDVWEDWQDRELDRVQLHDGTYVHRDAWEWHQAFKREFIATMDRAGGTIPAVVIAAWVQAMSSGPN